MGIQIYSATGNISSLKYEKTDNYSRLFFVLNITEHVKDKSGKNIITSVPCVMWDSTADNFNKFLTNGDDVDIVGKIRTLFDKNTNAAKWHVEVAEFNVHDTLGERLLKNLDYKDVGNWRSVWNMYFKDTPLSDEQIEIMSPHLNNPHLDQEDIQTIMAEMLHLNKNTPTDFVELAKSFTKKNIG